MDIHIDRFKTHRQRARTPRIPDDEALEGLRDLRGEEEADQEDAPVGGAGRIDAGEGREGDPPPQDAGGAGAAGGGQLPVQRAKPREALNAHGVLELMGEQFLLTYAQDTGRAWTQLMLSVMQHLALLADSGLVQNLKDLLAVAREVEEHIRKTVAVGGGRDGELRLPMDEIGSRWRVEQQSDESAAIPTKTNKRSRRKIASASKSTISSESPSSSEKTKSETNGLEP